MISFVRYDDIIHGCGDRIQSADKDALVAVTPVRLWISWMRACSTAALTFAPPPSTTLTMTVGMAPASVGAAVGAEVATAVGGSVTGLLDCSAAVPVGAAVGGLVVAVGATVVGAGEGAAEGALEGDCEGALEGALEGAAEGALEGEAEGALEGTVVGCSVRRPVGAPVGDTVGSEVVTCVCYGVVMRIHVWIESCATLYDIMAYRRTSPAAPTDTWGAGRRTRARSRLMASIRIGAVSSMLPR